MARYVTIIAISLLLIIVIIYNMPDNLYGKGGISISLQQSKELGVLIAQKTPSKSVFHVDKSTSFYIKEVFYERDWRCGPKCQTALEISKDIYPNHLVIKCSDKSNFDDLNGSWSIKEAETGETITSSGNNGLIFQNYSKQVSLPIKFLIFKHSTKVDSLVIR
ncbi:hypothetical protein [Hymenobacter lapidarius]|uniref:hypothetical protein n=1 Tax=Hymenobacter lapidarius TaxID=1908237 RepID=UPI000F77C7EC|nr:hypothetical protein [Hymenobacter lapidarius]